MALSATSTTTMATPSTPPPRTPDKKAFGSLRKALAELRRRSTIHPFHDERSDDLPSSSTIAAHLASHAYGAPISLDAIIDPDALSANPQATYRLSYDAHGVEHALPDVSVSEIPSHNTLPSISEAECSPEPGPSHSADAHTGTRTRTYQLIVGHPPRPSDADVLDICSSPTSYDSPVFAARFVRTGAPFTLKKFDKRAVADLRLAVLLRNETAAYRRVRERGGSEFVSPLLAAIQSEDAFHMLLPRYTGDLHERAGSCKTSESQRWTLQIAAGLSVLHRMGIMHRSLSPSSVLLTQRGDAVLSDFALSFVHPSSYLPRRAVSLRNPRPSDTRVGGWSPQRISGRGYDKMEDFWALGVLLWQLRCGADSHPFFNNGEGWDDRIQRLAEYEAHPETGSPQYWMLQAAFEHPTAIMEYDEAEILGGLLTCRVSGRHARISYEQLKHKNFFRSFLDSHPDFLERVEAERNRGFDDDADRSLFTDPLLATSPLTTTPAFDLFPRTRTTTSTSRTSTGSSGSSESGNSSEGWYGGPGQRSSIMDDPPWEIELDWVDQEAFSSSVLQERASGEEKKEKPRRSNIVSLADACM